jgi:hypothetical protein
VADLVGSSKTQGDLYRRAVDDGWAELPDGVRRLLQRNRTLTDRVRESVVHSYLHTRGCSPVHVRMQLQPDFTEVTRTVAAPEMQDFIRQVAAVRDRITARLQTLRVGPGDPRGPLVLAVELVQAGTIDEATVDAAVTKRWDEPGPRTDESDPIWIPPATHARWKTIPDDPTLMAELHNRLHDTWQDRPETIGTSLSERDMLALHEDLFAIPDTPGTSADFQAEWDRYVDHRPWTAHEKALDRCGLSLNSAPATEPALDAPTPGMARLDRGVLQRLDRPLRQPRELAEVFARISVYTLVVDEIGRSVHPLGLRDEQALAALAAGLAAADLIGRTDPRERPESTEHAPARVEPFRRVEKLARRYHGQHKSWHSPDSLQVIVDRLRTQGRVDQARVPVLINAADRYRGAMEDPIRSIGPRLHPRLHRADIARAQGFGPLAATDWWERIDAALNSWIKDVYGDINTVLKADPDPARQDPTSVQRADPAMILELMITLLEDGDSATADPLAILDVTAEDYHNRLGEHLRGAYGVTAQQAQEMLPPWTQVSSAISPDLEPAISLTQLFVRSRAVCRRLHIMDELSRADPQVAVDLYANAVAAHVANARAAGALVGARHYSAPAAFVTRLRGNRRDGTGQVTDAEKEEGS